MDVELLCHVPWREIKTHSDLNSMRSRGEWMPCALVVCIGWKVQNMCTSRYSGRSWSAWRTTGWYVACWLEDKWWSGMSDTCRAQKRGQMLIGLGFLSWSTYLYQINPNLKNSKILEKSQKIQKNNFSQ